MNPTVQQPPLVMFGHGFTDLISVIPPGSSIAPTSVIPPAMVGKIPGRRLANGTWAGYDWRSHATSEADIRRWASEGSSFGLRADSFPGVDIDSMDPGLGNVIAQIAREVLGSAPERVGRAPKRLLVYRTLEPFARLRLWIITPGGARHLVEVLGRGQQYLVLGTHPATGMPYQWDRPISSLVADQLTEISLEDARRFLDVVRDSVEVLGYSTESEGDGVRGAGASAAADQEGLRAPSPELLEQVVRAIPNTSAQFPTRTDYLRVGYAIYAAGGNDAEHLWLDWTGRWEDGVNDPNVAHDDWRRFKGPYAVGWSWLREMASANGFRDADGVEFGVVEAPATPEAETVRPLYGSEHWLAEQVIKLVGGLLRYCPPQGRWYVWDGVRWVPDAIQLAERRINGALVEIAREVSRRGASEKELAAAERLGLSFLTAYRASAVRTLMESDQRVAVGAESLDADPWSLNTPSGIVDLRTGAIRAATPDDLCTKVTAVGPDPVGDLPNWLRFLQEATAGDLDTQGYLHRLMGYCLTGVTREQQLTFIWGPGGNGKSVFLGVLEGLLADYAQTAAMDTFTASRGDRHSTELAMLAGSRLVTASETGAGRRWDEQRVKSLTGGDRVSARFMRQDNFTFLPQFKLVFVGNHRPEIRDVDAAMRRRIHLVPFVVKPAEVDLDLKEKLRAEWPAILSWALRGSVLWAREGLRPSAAIRAATDEYFSEEDGVGKWLEEALERDPQATETTEHLLASWTEWANANNEYVGSAKRLVQALITRGAHRWRETKTRKMGLAGYRLRPVAELGILT